MSIKDVVDEIDRLVDEQMAGGEPRQGYNYKDPTYPKCWHCGRHWHGLPVTEEIAKMYARGVFDERYRVDSDDSPVLCQGSNFIGPMPPEPWSYTVHYWSELRDRSMEFANYLTLNFPTLEFPTSSPPSRDRWWRIVLPPGATMTRNLEPNTVTIEVGEWWQTFHDECVRAQLWQDFDEVRAFQFNAPVRQYDTSRIVLDVLQEDAPIGLRCRVPGAFWRPLTALGVTRHPTGRNGAHVD